MCNFNVKDIMESNSAEPEKMQPAIEPAIKKAPWDAEEAFRRLNITRDVRRALTSGISENVMSIPSRTLARYETVITLLKQLETDEILTIQFGE